LPIAKEASFYSYERQHDPTCLPDTRVDLLEKIRHWADGEHSPTIFWLNGLAGTGKSTVARTLVQRYSETGRIAASFFFSRDGGEGGYLRHAGKFVTSIAVQLANNVQILKQTICDKIFTHSDIAHRSLREQWRHLILDPLSTLGTDNGGRPLLLVVDALDECEGENDIRTILQLFSEIQSLVQLRVFLTSRPEVPIRNGFVSMSEAEHQDFILHSISPAIVDHDIRIFLEHSFKSIARERTLGSSWPGENIIERLVQNSSGLFIWAATACRFIREGKILAPRRLDIILERSSTTINAPEKHLNDIYTTVLGHCIPTDYSDSEKEELQHLLKSLLGSIVLLLAPLGAKSLSNLLGTTQDHIHRTLDDLHAIMHIPEESALPLRLHHPSFRDFLLDERRSGDSSIWVDEEQMHKELAAKCVELMQNVFNQHRCTNDRPAILIAICDNEQPGKPIFEVGSQVINEHLHPEVQYACSYWAQHLKRGRTQLYDFDRVHMFLKNHLLHWIETLAWMRKVPDGLYAIIALETLFEVSVL
jgi:hypothetical protein